MAKRPVNELKASFGVKAEVPEPKDIKAKKLPGSKDGGDSTNPKQGSSVQPVMPPEMAPTKGKSAIVAGLAAMPMQKLKGAYESLIAPEFAEKADLINDDEIQSMLEQLGEDFDFAGLMEDSLTYAETVEFFKEHTEVSNPEALAAWVGMVKYSDSSEEESIIETVDFNPEDFKVSQEDLKINEEVKTIFKDSEISEEIQDKAIAIFETAVAAKINDVIPLIAEKVKAVFESENEEKFKSIAEKISVYLDYVVEEWMKENKLAVETGLKVEMTQDFLSGLKNLFVEHYVELPEAETDVTEALAAKVEELEKTLNEQISANVELKAKVTEFEKQSIIDEASVGLSETQISKLTSLTEVLDVDNVDTFKKKVAEIKETYFSKTETGSSESTLDNDPVDIEEEKMVEEVDPSMQQYVSAISRGIKK